MIYLHSVPVNFKALLFALALEKHPVPCIAHRRLFCPGEQLL